MRYVEYDTEIPLNQRKNMQEILVERMKSQLDAMNDAQLKILVTSEASFRSYVKDLFKTIAKLFGYVVGQVVGFFRDIGDGLVDGWREGYNAGRGY